MLKPTKVSTSIMKSGIIGAKEGINLEYEDVTDQYINKKKYQ